MWLFNPLFIRNYNRSLKYSYFVHRQIENMPINVMGVWDTNYGRLVMIQEGNKITGYYPSYDGTVDGVIDGNILIGNWWDQDEEGKNFGQYRLDFSVNDFVGSWGYNNKPFYYNWIGEKISAVFSDYNCYRYRLQHDSPEVPEVIFNDKKIAYGQNTSYYYPKECSSFVHLVLKISGEIINRKIPVEPGYSYTFSIQGNLPNITIDAIIDNPL